MCACVRVCVCRGESPLQARFKQSGLLPSRAHSAPGHGLALTRGPVKGLSEPFRVARTPLPCPPWKDHPSSARPRVPAPEVLPAEALPTAPHKAPSATSLPSTDCPGGSPSTEALAALGNAPDDGRTPASTAVLHCGLLGTYTTS